jgi:hypothetical protein
MEEIMNIEEIRKLSLEYANGVHHRHRLPRGNKLRQRRSGGYAGTYAEWFADSLKYGKRAGPPPHQPKAVDKWADGLDPQEDGAW